MKEWYVYELVNLMGTVEYVGESTNIKKRLNYHVCNAGKFAKRVDIVMNIIKSFNSKREAYDYQCELQELWGLKTDREIMRIAKQGQSPSLKAQKMGGKIGGKIIANTNYTCPHCNKQGKGVIMKRWHFENCKKNK